ncbi:MFS transporter [Streptomyces sp. NPDC018031]|uniref:MFS transporter n=1 Tax=Streptomyces sp. NPDC018031 TaxID=3365033 RepID=UPI00379D212C
MLSPALSPAPKPSYAAVLRAPDVPRTFGAALLGRISYGIVFLALTVALTQALDSYAWAGVAIALFGLSTSLLAPVRAGLIDRHGPRRVLRPLATVHAALLAALAAATWTPGAAAWILLPLTCLAGAAAPPLGPVMRAVWSELLPDAALRQRAFSLDTVCEELLYVIGPVLAGVAISLGRPAAGVAASAVLVLAGTLLMTSSPALRRHPGTPGESTSTGTEDLPRGGDAAPAPGDRPRRRRPGRHPLSGPVLVTGGMGLALGAAELLIVVSAERHHQVAAVSWLQACLSAGGAAGGLAYGTRVLKGPTGPRLALLGLALALALAVTGLAPGLLLLAVGIGTVGICVAPALTTAYLAADEAAAPHNRVRAGTWVNTAFTVGTSAGTASVGLLAGHLPLSACFAAAALPLAVSAAVALGRSRHAPRTEPRPAAVEGRS